MPRTYNKLFDKITDFENLFAAYVKARRCKRYHQEVLRFSSRLEDELIAIQDKLIGGTYRTGSYYRFVIYEPKRREIAALPFRDRVVHHALCNVIEPLFERKFVHDSYGCRIRKGTHAGSERLIEFLRRAQRAWGKVYCLKGDIEKFFPSVDHDALKDMIRRTIRCRWTLHLIDGIIDSTPDPRGMPIGNLTSQLFANVYLNELDHFVKEKLCVRFYVRYMDDFILIHPAKERLHVWRESIAMFLHESLRLNLNSKTSVFPISRGVDFLGYRTWPTHRLLRKRSVVSMRRKLKALAERYGTGEVSLDTIQPIIASWLGHAKHAESYNVRKKLLGNVVYKRQ